MTTLKKEPTTELVTVDPKVLAEINSLGGGQSMTPKLPQFKLEHTTDGVGEANPLKSHFTLSKPNDLGEYVKTDLGEKVKAQILKQRYCLDMTKGDVRYTSKEFDNNDDIVRLYQSTGQGENRSSTLYSEGTPFELGKNFLVKNTKGQTYSELMVKFVLYMIVGDEIVRWKLNSSGSVAYKGYARRVKPFVVITELTREEDKKGANKYYRPVFTAVEKLTDFRKILDEQKSLNELVLMQQPAVHEESKE
ncbi:MAG: hypothetical protein WCV68_04555 [Candidatus Paceibacterota bacterium]|jgi:hypothetical protein